MSMYNLEYKQQKDKHDMGPMHTHDFYEIEYNISGNRQYFTKTKMFHLVKGSLIVIRPGTTHKFISGGCRVYTLQVSPESLSEDQKYFLDKLAQKEGLQLPLQRLAQIDGVYKKLLSIRSSFPFSENKKMQFHLQLGTLFQLFYKYVQTSSNDSAFNNELSPSITPIVFQVLDYVKNNYKEDFTLDDVCKKFEISKSYLSSCFMKATGHTLFQYKLSLQLEEAKRLCRETRHSYDKIAELTGFSSGNYFRLIFKKHVGQTPKQHRYNSFEKRKRPSR